MIAEDLSKMSKELSLNSHGDTSSSHRSKQGWTSRLELVPRVVEESKTKQTVKRRSVGKCTSFNSNTHYCRQVTNFKEESFVNDNDVLLRIIGQFEQASRPLERHPAKSPLSSKQASAERTQRQRLTSALTPQLLADRE